MSTVRMGRRGFLTVGAVAGAGLTLADFFQLQQAQAEQKNYDFIEAKAKSVIHIFLPGRHGPSGIVRSQALRSDRVPRRTEAHSRPRSPAKSVLASRCPRRRQIADKITVIRSMTHGEAAHERGTHNMFTGYRPSPALMFPSMGSVVSHEYGPRNNLPPYVCIPNQPNEFAGTGYLSSSFAPFSLGSRSGCRRLQGSRPEPARRRRRCSLQPPPLGAWKP